MGRAAGEKSAVIALSAVVIVALSANESTIFYLLHEPSLRDLINYSTGALEGRAAWRAFQNRLLGPLIFRAFERVFAGPGAAPSAASFAAFAGLAIFIKNAMSVVLLTMFTGSPVKGLLLTAVGTAAFIGIAHPLFYLWDFLDLIFFYAFAYMAFTDRAVGPAFLALFVATLLNRESAAFFGFWLLLRRLSRRDLIIGALLVLIAAAYTKAMRDVLFVESPLVGADESHTVLGNHFVLGINLAQIMTNMASSQVYVNFYLLGITAHGALLACAGRRSGDPHRLALGLYVLGFLAAVLIFGVINETRVYLTYLPFLVFSLAAYGPDIQHRLAAIDDQWSKSEPR